MLASTARFNVVNCGRRWGKTEMAKRLLAEKALQGSRVAYLAPTYPMAHQFYREMADQLATVTTGREVNRRIDVVGGGFIDIWSLENGADRVRGQKYHRIVNDECAIVIGMANTWEKVLRPTLVDYQGDAWFLSTPRRGSDFETFYRHEGDEWASWHRPSWTNPLLPAEEIERMRETMSAQAFAQEIGADFEASESDLVHNLDRSKTVRAAPCRWDECKWRVVGIDPGGGDPTAMVPLGVASPGDGSGIHQYGEFYRRGDVTIEMMAEYLTRLGPLDRVFVGETGGNVITNTLIQLGFPAQKAEMRRGEGIEHVQWLLETGRLTIDPACKESIAEFAGYRWDKRRDQETGERYATSTPADHHADAMDARRYAAVGILQLLPSGSRQPMKLTRPRMY